MAKKKAAERQTRRRAKAGSEEGKLRIGDDWNAINIIALSQSNPLKAVAEFVENSIDAGAAEVTITRGRESGESFLRVEDDGEGIPKNEDGVPNFQYVATHICDSIKRQLRSEGHAGLQGEFGIGLLSFWTVGDELRIESAGQDGHVYEMRMKKGDPTYSVRRSRRIFPHSGTSLTIRPLLTGIRHFTGEKLDRYLASELRDRIRSSGVRIEIKDRYAKKTYVVEPRQFSGQLIHDLPEVHSELGDIYAELYLADPKAENRVGLYRSGTRVIEDITDLPYFQTSPWNTGYLQGLIDGTFLNLTPGTRLGIIQDEAFEAFCLGIEPLAKLLDEKIQQQKRAEEERASRETFQSIRKAFREAVVALPRDEYDWFRIALGDDRGKRRDSQTVDSSSLPARSSTESTDGGELVDMVNESPTQQEFFDCSGPMCTAVIFPKSCVMGVGQQRELCAVAKDRDNRVVEQGLSFAWSIVEGEGDLLDTDQARATFVAPAEPSLVRLQVAITQGETVCTAEGLVTVADSLLPRKKGAGETPGLPGYTYQRAPGQLWRSRYDGEQNVIVINSGHRDFVHVAPNRMPKLRYICRLYAKELVCLNFQGYSPNELLERMIEISLYTEENLR